MIFLIGLGAAGNKAVIKAMEMAVIESNYAMLINSTEKDIPNDYKDKSLIIGNNLKGCGKERSLAKNAIVSYLKENEPFANIPGDVDRIVVVTSSEGGTGSGSSPILAKYLRDVLGYDTSIFAFTGFEDDVRGLKNTIEFMKELDEDSTIQIISNKKFLEEANGNYVKAQDLANEEFCKRALIMSGDILQESDQNIDDTDLHKLIDSAGLLDIVYIDIEEPFKNIEAFNKACSKMVDESKSIDINTTASRIGVIFNGRLTDAIDFSCKTFKSKYGEPYEVYTHIQENDVYKKEFLACIASGMKLPIDAMQRTYDEYLDRTSKISKDKDSFFDKISSFEEMEDDKTFDMKRKNTKSNKEAFFKDF